MATRAQPALPSPRKVRAADTRAAILAAAERIFAEAGLAGARTDAIAARAGVNKALLYYYFKSKDTLFHAVLEDHLKEFYRQGMETLGTGGSARATLLRYVSMHFDFIASRPYYPRLFQRLTMTGGRPLARLAERYISPLGRKLAEVIRHGMATGEFRPCDPQHTAISLAALTVFYFSAAPVVRVVGHLDPYATANLRRRKEEVLRFARYGLFSNPEEPFE